MVSTKEANMPACLRYRGDVRIIFASAITGTLSHEIYISTKICADEKTMYVKQLAKFCCIVHRANAQQKLSEGNAVLIGRGCLCNLSHCNISRDVDSVVYAFYSCLFFSTQCVHACSDFQRRIPLAVGFVSFLF